MIVAIPARPGGQSGFSLLEILVALSVMVVGMTSIMVLFAVGVTTHKRSVDQMNAAIAAESVFSEIEAKYTIFRIDQWKKKSGRSSSGKGSKRVTVDEKNYLRDVPAQGADEPKVPNFPGYRYRMKYTPLDQDGDAVLAELTIVWQKGGDPVAETFKKVIFKKPF